VTRLEREAKAKIFLEDTNIITTWLASSVKFLNGHRDLAKKIAAANKELTDWIQTHPDEAQKTLIAELKEETKTQFAPDAVAQAWKRIRFTTEVSGELVAKAVQDGKDAATSTPIVPVSVVAVLPAESVTPFNVTAVRWPLGTLLKLTMYSCASMPIPLLVMVGFGPVPVLEALALVTALRVLANRNTIV
jgi:hypothetical protein